MGAWDDLNKSLGKTSSPAAAPDAAAPPTTWDAINKASIPAAAAKRTQSFQSEPGVKTVDLSKTGAGEVKIGPSDQAFPQTERNVPESVKQQKRQEAGLPADKAQVDHVTPLGIGGTNSEKNLVAIAKAEAAYKDKVEKYFYRELKDGRIGQREAIVRMQRWRDQELPDQPAWNKTPAADRIAAGEVAKSLPAEVAKTYAGAAKGMAQGAAAAGEAFGGQIEGFVGEMGKQLGNVTKAVRASSALASTPFAYLLGRGTGGKETYAEVANASMDVAKGIMKGEQPVADAAAQYVRRMQQERGGKTPTMRQAAKDLGVLSVVGLSDLLGDPAYSAAGLVKVANEAVDFARFKKVGERVIAGRSVVPEVITKEGETVAPQLTKIKEAAVDIRVAEGRKVRLTPTKEGPVVVEGFQDRFGPNRESTRVVPAEPKAIGGAVRDVTASARELPATTALPMNELKVSPQMFQMSRAGEMKAGLLNESGAEPKRVAGYTTGRGFDPEQVRKNPLLVGEMTFDDPQSGIKAGDRFLIGGHNRLQMLRDAGYSEIPADMYRVKRYDTLGQAVKDSVSSNIEGKVTAYDHNVVNLVKNDVIGTRELVDIYGGDVRKAEQVQSVAGLMKQLPDATWENIMKKMAVMKDVEQRLVDRKMAAFETLAKATARIPELLSSEDMKLKVADAAAKIANVSDDRSMKSIENRVGKLADAKDVGAARQSDLFGALEPASPEQPAPAEQPTSPFGTSEKTALQEEISRMNPSQIRDEYRQVEDSLNTLEGAARTEAVERSIDFGNELRDYMDKNEENVLKASLNKRDIARVDVTPFDDGKWMARVIVLLTNHSLHTELPDTYESKDAAAAAGRAYLTSYLDEIAPSVTTANEKEQMAALRSSIAAGEPKTQTEKVKKAVAGAPKSVKSVAEETGILEPNVRRILGVGAKEGTFDRVAPGVYVLSVDGKDVAYIHARDAVEALPELVAKGVKVDMVFLDPPYDTPAIVGGNRKLKFKLMTPEAFGSVVKNVGELVRDENTPVYYISSQAPSGMREMQKYTQQILDAGFKVVARGEYTKLQKDGINLSTNPQGKPAHPEAVWLFTKSGEHVEKDLPRNLTFRLVRPPVAGSAGYQTQKPAEMLASLIFQGTTPGDVVLDPFAGSGTTPAEAVRAGRTAIAFEINPDVVERLVKPRVAAAAQESAAEREARVRRDISAGKYTLEAKNADALSRLKNQIGDTFTLVEPHGSLWHSGGDVLFIRPNRAAIGYAAQLRTNNAVESVQEAGNNIYKVQLKPAPSAPAAKEVPQQGLFDVPAQPLELEREPQMPKEPAAEPKPLEKQSRGGARGGGFASVKGEGFPETPVVMGGIDAIRPIEMPELVKIARDIIGRAPKVKKLPKALGLMHAEGKGRITLSTELFKMDEQTVAKVMAHELGHLVDFQDDLNIKRGNLIGRVNSLSGYMKGTFGESEVKDKTLREELIAWTRYWHPYDPAAVKESYRTYRESSVELYADALSGLFTSPGLLEEKAPNFYKEFFAHLDEKPEVKRMYFEMQEILASGEDAVLGRREADIRTMFQKGEDARAKLAEIAEKRRKDVVTAVRIAVEDRNAAMRARLAKFEREGGIVAPQDDPRLSVEEESFADNVNFLMARDVNENVIVPLEAAGISQHDLGEYLFLKRVVGRASVNEAEMPVEFLGFDDADEKQLGAIAGTAGDRSTVANPLGFTKSLAERQLEFLRTQLGTEKYAMLEEKAQAFHDVIFRSVEEAVRVGSYSKEVFNKVLRPNKDVYVTFGVINHLQAYTPAGIKKQKGTLSEIENPVITTLMKTMALNRLNSKQRASIALRDAWLKNFPDEIAKSEEVKTEKGARVDFKAKEGMAVFKMLEDGKMTGYDLDPYIVRAFERSKIGDLQLALVLHNVLQNQLFKSIFVTFNAGFQTFNFIRDFKRTYRNLNALGVGVSLKELVRQYVRAIPPSYRMARGVTDATISDMLQERALDAVTFSDYRENLRDDSFGQVLERAGVHAAKDDEMGPARKALSRIFAPILEALRFTGNIIEALPKVAAYNTMAEKEVDDRRRAHITRTYVGTPPYKTKGELTPITNEIFMFSNIIIQGMKTDAALASRPATRGGWWWKTLQMDLLPKFLMFLAGTGLLGATLKRQMDKATEYDKTNYIVVPLGEKDDGTAVYARIPHDEGARIIASMAWKLMNIMRPGTKEWSDLANVAGGQLPGLSPTLSMAGSWFQYAIGHNPYDTFRGRNVLSDDVALARGKEGFVKMVEWTANETGLARFQTQNAKTGGWFQTTLDSLPLSNVIPFAKMLRVTDYGIAEKSRLEISDVDAQNAARQRIKDSRTVDEYVLKASKAGADKEALKDELVMKIIGHEPDTSVEKRKATLLKKKFDIALARGGDDPTINRLIAAHSNDEKVKLLRFFKETLPRDRYDKVLQAAHDAGVVSDDVIDEMAQ